MIDIVEKNGKEGGDEFGEVILNLKDAAGALDWEIEMNSELKLDV